MEKTACARELACPQCSYRMFLIGDIINVSVTPVVEVEQRPTAQVPPAAPIAAPQAAVQVAPQPSQSESVDSADEHEEQPAPHVPSIPPKRKRAWMNERQLGVLYLLMDTYGHTPPMEERRRVARTTGLNIDQVNKWIWRRHQKMKKEDEDVRAILVNDRNNNFSI